ncbi:hypothetical protein B0181_06225 [Moraxella caviae]|uniref:HTH gntR-type domain-containing protein n=1 Tax=Moraxella caviae TaxID=34060 RepID=A0A1T0A1K2_9GAMM|nr:hypothetical protein B0181_06225 [Moraxella caviae]
MCKTTDETSVPVYERIKRYILAHIHDGRWRTGAMIPSENELAETFGVSRMTVNRAVKELAIEGVLERKQGAGTFVIQKQFSQTFVTVHSIAEDIERMGKRYHAKQIFGGAQAYNTLPAEAQKLFTPQQTPYRVDVVHFGDDVPLQYERRWVDLNLVPKFAEQDFNIVSTSNYLIAQTPLVRGLYTIEALACPDDIASCLAMPAGAPALCLRRHTYSGELVVTLVQMWHNGANFSFTGTLE